MAPETGRRPLSLRGRPMRAAAVALASLVLCGASFTVGGTAALFGAQAGSPSTFATGTTRLDDNDDGTAVVALSNATPGTTSTGCVKVTSNGSLASSVKLYASVSGSLAQYVTLTVTRGTSASAYPSCSGFVADPTDYLGSGAGVVYSGTLASYPATYASGIVDPPSGGAETWTQGETHAYEISVTLADDQNAQGLSASVTFQWEAQNL